MDTFIGVKCVKAEWQCNDKGEPGYRVVYPDGYESWCPGEAFEKYYFPITSSDKLTPGTTSQTGWVAIKTARMAS